MSRLLLLALGAAAACSHRLDDGDSAKTECDAACAKLPVGKFASIGGAVNASSSPYLNGEDVRIASDGNPAVVYGALIDSTSSVYYAAWDGSTWAGLLGSETTGIDAGATSFATLRWSSTGEPNVGYLGVSNSIAFRAYDGAAWSELAGSATPPALGTGTEPALALDATDAPIMTWTSGGASSEIYLRRFDGTSWQELAGSASAGGVSNTPGASSSNPDIATATNGDIFAVWQEAAGHGCTYVKRYDGVAWSELAGSASGDGISGAAGDAEGARVVTDANGLPVVAWAHDTNSVTEIYLRRFDGTAWQELGGSATGGGVSAMGLSSSLGSVSLDASDNPVVSWTTNLGAAQRVFLRRWDGSAWVELDGSASGDGIGLAQIGSDVGVHHDTRGDELCVMWTHGDSQSYPSVRVKCMRMP